MSAWGSPCGEDIQFIALPKRWVNAERGWCWEFLLATGDFCRPREEYIGQEGIGESLGCYPLIGPISWETGWRIKNVQHNYGFFWNLFSAENTMNRLKKICLQPTESTGYRKPWIIESFSMVWTWTRTMSTFSTFSFSLPLTGQVASESISLELPVDVVPDSSKAYVTVLGK